ncbi:hypothetical protein [Kordia sp.]|uniref:hypothetical protein n=1 Tax=Kordia sp. TaxID=1965332 RepID=UPI003D6AB13F
MKKRNVSILALNKRKISELQNSIGGFRNESDGCPTNSGCSCVSCRPSCEEPVGITNQGCDK